MAHTVRLNTTAIRDRMTLLGIDDFTVLGKLTGVERSVASRMVRNERSPKPSFMVKLASVLDTPLEAIIAPSEDTLAAIEAAA